MVSSEIPQTVFALEGFGQLVLGVGGCWPGVRAARRASPNRVYYDTKSMSCSSRAGETVVFFSHIFCTIEKQHFPSRSLLGQPWAPRDLESWNPGILKSCNLGILESWELGVLGYWIPGTLESCNLGILESGTGSPFLETGCSFLNTGFPFLNIGLAIIGNRISRTENIISLLGSRVSLLKAGVPFLKAGHPFLKTGFPFLKAGFNLLESRISLLVAYTKIPNTGFCIVCQRTSLVFSCAGADF